MTSRDILREVKARGIRKGTILEKDNKQYQVLGMAYGGKAYELEPRIVVNFYKPYKEGIGTIDIMNLSNYKVVGKGVVSYSTQYEETYNNIVNFAEIQVKGRVGSLIKCKGKYELIVSVNPILVYEIKENKIPSERKIAEYLGKRVKNEKDFKCRKLSYYMMNNKKLVKQYNEKEIKAIILKIQMLRK